jgi:hypothetical protein
MPYTRFSILLVMSLAFSSFLVQLFVWVPRVKFFGSWEQVSSHVLATLVVSLILKFWLGNLTKLTLLLNCSGFWLLSNYCNYDLCLVVKMSFFFVFFNLQKEFYCCQFLNFDAACGDIRNWNAINFLYSFSSLISLSPCSTAGKSRFGSLLGQSPGKTDRLYMKGPGGRGEVEVAVSGVAGKSGILFFLISWSLSVYFFFLAFEGQGSIRFPPPPLFVVLGLRLLIVLQKCHCSLLVD